MDFLEDFDEILLRNYMDSLQRVADPYGWLEGLSAIAVHAGVSVVTVRKRIKNGDIIAYKVGSKWRSNKEWFNDFLWNGNRIIGTAGPGT